MNAIDEMRILLQTFSLVDWKIVAHNYDAISDSLSIEDRQLFPCSMADFKASDLMMSSEQGWRCLRKYLLKEDVDDLSKARNRMKL